MGVGYSADTQARIAAVYPYDIKTLGMVAVDRGDPCVDAPATIRQGTGRGGLIEFDKSVRIAGGASKATVDGANSIISVAGGTSISDCSFQINGAGCSIIIGPNCRLKGLTIVVRRPNSLVLIGSNTTWESGAIISESGNMIVAGSDCMFSNSVILRTSDGHSIFDAASRERLNKAADVLVGSHVWLGNSSRANKGAIIESGAVVGQCSVVSGRVLANCVYAGAPARKVREGIVWSRTETFEGIPAEYII